MPSVFFDKSRKKWFAQVQVDGQRFGKRFTDKHAARRWADELEFDLKRALQKKNPVAHLYAMENGRLPLENQFAAVTFEYIQRRVLRYKSYQQNGTSMYNGIQKRLGHHKLFDFTTRLLEDYAYKRVDEDGVSAVTMKKEIEAIKRILDYAKRNFGWRPADPFDWPLEPDLPQDLRAHDEIRGRQDQEPITPSDFKKILHYVDAINHEVTLALIVLYETAMRRGEVIKLRKEWVRFDAPAHIRIPGSEHKNKKPKVVMLTPVAVLAMEEVFDRETEDGRVFQFSASTDKGKGAYLWKCFKDACKEVLNRPYLIVHNIRLENATQLAERGMEDELRQRQTGHVDRKVLNDRYTRNRPEHRAMYYEQSFLSADTPTHHPSKH